MPDHPQLEALVSEVLAGPKYNAISPELVRRIGARELAAHRSLKEAIKETKSKLHQVAGAYFDTRPDYAAWLAELQAQPGTPEQKAACRRVMQRHASTRERLPILEDFYSTTLAGLPPIHSVLDLACGLNPLAMPWMPLAPSAAYYACDIYADLAVFLNQFFGQANITGTAEVCNLVEGPPTHKVDLALALKILPPLEQLAKGASLRLLQALDAPAILVSFPAQSLGGRNKGMAANYEQQFRNLIANESWQVTRYSFPSELAFMVQKEQGNKGTRTVDLVTW